MVPDTGFLLELNSTRKHSSMLGVNLCFSETTNKLTGTTQKIAPLSMKSIQSPVFPIKPDGDLEVGFRDLVDFDWSPRSIRTPVYWNDYIKISIWLGNVSNVISNIYQLINVDDVGCDLYSMD